MTKFHGMTGGFVLTGLAIFLMAEAGRAQVKTGQGPAPGPGTEPATLKVPWLESSPKGGASPSSGTGLPSYFENRSAAGSRSFPPYQEAPDPNKDILVTPNQGPWMICVAAYMGPEAHDMARKMVMELSNNPTYKLPAYVFNRGADERKKEYERVKAIVEKQHEFLATNNLPANTPLRVKVRHIEEQCAVLVGNYKTPEEAKRALDQIRKVKPPPPEIWAKRIDLATVFRAKVDQNGKVIPGESELAYVNPFTNAFVAHNPALKVERPADWQKEDMEVLRKLNRNEEFSLLQCKKPYTLLVKHFYTPTVLQSQSAGGKFLETIGLGGKSATDNAALNAHNLAGVFRKMQLDGFAMHTRYASIVTVGAFDSLEDPTLKSTQELLLNRLKIPQVSPIPVPR